MSRVFRYLLYFYPPAYRHEYGEEMISVFSQVQEETGKRGLPARSLFWAREAGGLLCGALQEHARSLTISHPHLLFESRRFSMRAEFRFPKATAWLMPIILAAIVMAVEKAKTIQASLPAARPLGTIPSAMHFSFLLTILLIAAVACGAGLIGWAILFALRRSGLHRLSELNPSGMQRPGGKL
jgi:hypothetical protein